VVWWGRQRLLARLRAEWGKPRARVRRIDAIADYHRSRIAGETDGGGRSPSDSQSRSLDERTWSDLDLDAVFAAIDRTESTLGQQALYHRLRTAPVAPNGDAFEALVDRLSGDAPTRERVQMALSRLQDPHGYDLWWLAQPDSIITRPWHIIFPLLAAICLGALYATPFFPVALLILIIGGTLNVIVRIATVNQVGPLVGPFRQVGALISAGRELQCLSGTDIDPLVACLRTDVPSLRRLRLITLWVGRDPLKLGEIAGAIFEYVNLLLLLDVNAMFFGARELRRHGPALLRVIAAVGDVDAALSVANLRAGSRHWTKPKFAPPAATMPIKLTDLRHPLIEADACVPNSIVLAPPHGVLITGSNMSGKSTFLRTVGVNAVLAQTINTCFATEYEAPVFHVRTCIGRTDDLAAGKSYYIAEVEAVLALVRASRSSDPHLFLFDELFRGTNAVERIAAAEAVLADLITADGRRRRPHIVLTATHDAELVDLLRETYAAYHFTDKLGSEGLIFEHRLEPGPATTRNAIALLQLHGAPESLVRHALERAATLDHQRRTLQAVK
jgi:hypothetical protein